ncbi:MAG: ABC transporter ATP-binding protein [Ignavibacteria bacterium]|nr:ABC transporter ATP-binding protein [Ignavibacteria bacterium]
MEPIIEVEDLHKIYGDVHAVKGLSFTVERGDVYGFLGPNGAGKSTTIRILLTLIKPTSGTVRIFGKPLSQNRQHILSRIGAIVERPDFYNYLSAERNLQILGMLSGTNVSKAKLMRTLAIVGLEDRAKSKVKTFSHGMKQRLGIAQALIHNPDLIILDEPSTGLDPQGMVDLRNLILELSADHKKTIFLSSHILPEVELTASKMVIINKGTAMVEGSVRELISEGKLRVTFEVDSAEKAASVISSSAFADRLTSIDENSVFLKLSRSETSAVTQLLVQNEVSVEAVIPVRSLEDYFISITQGTK